MRRSSERRIRGSGQVERFPDLAHPVPAVVDLADLAGAVGNDAQFAALCRAIGREDLAKDERYATNPARVANREDLIAKLQGEFRKHSANDWIEFIQRAGVPCGLVNSLADVFSDEHVLGSGILRDVDHPSAGRLKMLASPILVDGERLPIRHPPPILEQHTEESGDRA